MLGLCQPEATHVHYTKASPIGRLMHCQSNSGHDSPAAIQNSVHIHALGHCQLPLVAVPWPMLRKQQAKACRWCSKH